MVPSVGNDIFLARSCVQEVKTQSQIDLFDGKTERYAHTQVVRSETSDRVKVFL